MGRRGVSKLNQLDRILNSSVKCAGGGEEVSDETGAARGLLLYLRFQRDFEPV